MKWVVHYPTWVHWAGTENSTISHGAVDGAVRSGQRAATEILART